MIVTAFVGLMIHSLCHVFCWFDVLSCFDFLLTCFVIYCSGVGINV